MAAKSKRVSPEREREIRQSIGILTKQGMSHDQAVGVTVILDHKKYGGKKGKK